MTLPQTGGGTATFIDPVGSQNISSNGTYDVTSLAEVVVSVSGGGGTGGVTQDQYGYLVLDENGGDTPTPPTPDPDPTDGKTHIWITIPDDVESDLKTIKISYTQTVSNGVTVDWGDGSTPESYTGTSWASHTHTYATTGDYEITTTVTSGTMQWRGGQSMPAIVSAGTSGYNKDYLIGASYVTRVFFGEKVTSVGQYCCYFAANLERVTVSSTDTTTIDQNAFRHCIKLTNISIANGVTTLGQYVFGYCTSLTELDLPDSITTLNSYTVTNCVSLRRLKLPKNVTDLPAYTVYTCYNITDITLPTNLQTTGYGCFQSCTAWRDQVASSVTIGSYAYAGNYLMEKITIPATVTSIASNAFSNCNCLREVHFLGATPPTFSTNIFSGSTGDPFTIYVPEGSLEAYATATNFTTYAQYIVEE